jgi:transaldolase
MKSRAAQLLDLGQSIWLDFIRRGTLVSGEFERQVRDAGVVGVTSNPTIFQGAIADSHDYDDALHDLVGRGLEGIALFEALAIEDIRMACDLLRPVWEKTGGRDGRVSLEVNPRLALDTAATIAEGRRLWQAVDRPNAMIKVPATAAGLPAITALTADGVSVNVTLIFSLDRYRQVMDAWMAGLEQRAAAGQPLDGIRSVASFFVSRVDGKVDKAIDAALAALPPGATERAELEASRGKAAIANARLAYAEFQETVAGERWRALAGRGAHVQRPLWASTSTKNAAYRDVLYVEELIGPDTVNTVPPQTLTAFNDHGVVESRIGNDLEGARALFRRLPALGVPVERLIDELEAEGVAAFAKSFEALLAALESRRAGMVA